MSNTSELAIAEKKGNPLSNNSINIQLTIDGMPNMEKVKCIQRALKQLDKLDRSLFHAFEEYHQLEMKDLDLATLRYLGEPYFDKYQQRMRLTLRSPKDENSSIVISLYSVKIEVTV